MILKGEDIDGHKNNTNDSNGKDGTDVNVVDMTQAAAFEFYRMKGKLPLLCAQTSPHKTKPTMVRMSIIIWR